MSEGNHPDLKQMAAKILDLLEPDLAADGFELLDIRIFRGGGRVQLRIYVDVPEGGIALDEVATASRTVGMLLEEADPFSGQYVIEVSSPGIRRPLRKIEHYRAAVGQKVDLKVFGPGTRRIRGILQELDGELLVVETEAEGGGTEETRVELKRVLEGNLDPDFDAQKLINDDRRRRKEDRRVERQAKKSVKKMRPKTPKPGSRAAKKLEDDSSNGETK